MLSEELDDILNIDMTDFGFDLDLDFGEDDSEEENPYTTRINIPQYEIKGEEPDLKELVDEEKTEKLIEEINNSNVTEEQKAFLKKSAMRHLGFNYSKVAEYYAHQNKERKKKKKKSALVIIDYDDAIKNGYVEISKDIEEMKDEELLYDEV